MIRPTLSNGVKIIDAFRARLELGVRITHCVHTLNSDGINDVFPKQSVIDLGIAVLCGGRLTDDISERMISALV